jgi:hypothetical protein
MKANSKTSIISALIFLGLLVSLIVGTQTGRVGGELTPRTTYHPGDPYTTVYYPIEVPTPNDAKSPVVTILSPANNTLITSHNVTLNFILTLMASNSSCPITLGPVCYKASWLSSNVTIDVDCSNPFLTKTLPISVDIANISEGTQSITVYSLAMCEYETSRENVSRLNTPTSILLFKYLYIYSNFYRIAGSSSINLTIDTLPKVSVVSPINQIYNDSSVSLVSAVDKPINWTGYSLDGRQNVTITGNTTLSGLSSGLHNLTIYAQDAFGSIGASEKVSFTVALSPFPTATFIAVSGAVAVVAGLLIYLKKIKSSKL